MPPLDPLCPQCRGPLNQDSLPPRCPWCGADLAPAPLDIEITLHDPPPTEPPAPNPAPPEPETVPLPDDAFDDVPVVRPAPVEELPEARPLPARRADPPPRVHDAPRTVQAEPRRPEPKIGLALLVLFGMIVAIGCALSVIVVALWIGFQTVSKPRRGEVPPPDLRAIAPVSRHAAGR